MSIPITQGWFVDFLLPNTFTRTRRKLAWLSLDDKQTLSVFKVEDSQGTDGPDELLWLQISVQTKETDLRWRPLHFKIFDHWIPLDSIKFYRISSQPISITISCAFQGQILTRPHLEAWTAQSIATKVDEHAVSMVKQGPGFLASFFGPFSRLRFLSATSRENGVSYQAWLVFVVFFGRWHMENKGCLECSP